MPIAPKSQALPKKESNRKEKKNQYKKQWAAAHACVPLTCSSTFEQKRPWFNRWTSCPPFAYAKASRSTTARSMQHAVHIVVTKEEERRRERSAVRSNLRRHRQSSRSGCAASAVGPPFCGWEDVFLCMWTSLPALLSLLELWFSVLRVSKFQTRTAGPHQLLFPGYEPLFNMEYSSGPGRQFCQRILVVAFNHC